MCLFLVDSYVTCFICDFMFQFVEYEYYVWKLLRGM